MNKRILPQLLPPSNAFSARRTDFDAQERKIAAFIKKGGIVKCLDEVGKLQAQPVSNLRTGQARVKDLLDYLRKTGAEMTADEIKEKFFLVSPPTSIGSLNRSAGKILIASKKRKKVKKGSNTIYSVYYAEKVE